MTADKNVTLTPEFLAGLGGGKIAYVRPIKGNQARDMFPTLPQIADNLDLWALVAADGSPLMLADSREAVVMNARENDLDAMSLH